MMPSINDVNDVNDDTQHNWDRKWLRLPLPSSGYTEVFLQIHVSLLARRCTVTHSICGPFLITETINIISFLSSSTLSSGQRSSAKSAFSISWPLLMSSPLICHYFRSHLNITGQKPITKPLSIRRESLKGQSKRESERLSLHHWNMKITLNFEELDNTYMGPFMVTTSPLALSWLCPICVPLVLSFVDSENLSFLLHSTSVTC